MYYWLETKQTSLYDHYMELGDVKVSIRYEMSLSLVSIDRQVYNVLNWLEDVGGFQTALQILAFLVLSFT